MPNRILKESITRSDEIDRLSWLEEVLFYRLIVSCDDYGRFDARTKIIKGQCFPLKDITEKDINVALKSLSDVGLIVVYEAQGRPVLQLVTWEQHQSIRAKKSKYPAFDDTCIQMYVDENEPQKTANVTKIIPKAPEKPKEPPVITIPLNTGEEWPVEKEDFDEWVKLYPAVDVMQNLRNMRGWAQSNPAKRKTARGMKRFINSWLQKEQDRGGTSGYRPAVGSSANGYGDRLGQLLNENRGDMN